MSICDNDGVVFDGSKAESKLTLGPEHSRNILDDYDVSTYHLKLFATNPVGLSFEEVKDPPPDLVIAETGKTDIGIDDLEFDARFGLTGDTYSAAYARVSFVIKEPLGATFLDRLRIAAYTVGSPNFIKMPFYLEITFVGRDRETGQAVTISDFSGTGEENTSQSNTKNIARKVFPIVINEVQTSIDRGGTVYKCSGVLLNDYGHSDQHGMIRSGTTLEVEDLKDALEQLGEYLSSEELQENEKVNHKQDPSKPRNRDKYKFKISKMIADEGQFVTGNPQELKTSRNDPYLEFNEGKTTIQINDNTAIARVIDLLLANTKYLQRRIKIKEENTEEENNKSNWGFKEVFKIDTDVRIMSYDSDVGDFIKEYCYKIVPYPAYVMTTNPQEYKNPRTIRSDHVGPIEGTARGGGNGGSGDNTEIFVVKNYSYIFTGKNFHVIDFNIDLKFAWYQEFPRQGGFFSGSSHDVGMSKMKAEAIERQETQARLNSDDLKPFFMVNENSGETYLKRPKDTEGVFPVSMFPSPSEHDADTTVERDRTAARGLTAAFLKTHVANRQAEFQIIDLTIRGDPFWLTAEDQKPIFFIFRTNYPDEPDDTGMVPKYNDTLLTGVFQILGVKHKFSGGKYTQVLEGRRDLLSKVQGKNKEE